MIRAIRSLALTGGLFVLFSLSCLAAFGTNAHVYIPDVEQGGCVVLVSPSGTAAVIDSGKGSSSDEDLLSFLHQLKDSGILNQIGYLVTTHFDADHIGKSHLILQDTTLVSPNVIVYDRGDVAPIPTSNIYNTYKTEASKHDRRVPVPGNVVDLGDGFTFTFMSCNGSLPNGTVIPVPSGNENAASVSVVVRYGGFDFFFGGDLETAQERGVATFAGDMDVIMLDHHGSNSDSNDSQFFQTLHAEVGIAQVGVNNSYGHPNKEAVARFLTSQDSFQNHPLFYQTNPGKATDTRVDNTLATGIADPDDTTTPTGIKPGTITITTDGFTYNFSSLGFNLAERPVDFPPGDLNGDGHVNSDDVLILAQYFASINNTVDTGKADLDGDGEPTMVDLTLLSYLSSR